MRKLFLVIVMCFCAVVMNAQSYGILVNGKMYFTAEYRGPDGAGEGFEEYLAHVQVKSGDYCQMYDVDNKAAWAKPLNTYSESGFTYDEANKRYNVSVTGCYDFYIKLKWEADELYIGPGTAECGEGIDITKEDPQPSYRSSAPEKCPDVLFQAFYWDSYGNPDNPNSTVHGRTKWIDFINGNNGTSAVEIGQWFDLVWLPPMSQATGGTGYIPTNYSNLNSDWGTEKRLRELVATLHKNGARVVADIVINHGNTIKNTPCEFAELDFGTYGKFHPDASWICNTDEMNNPDKQKDMGACFGTATGGRDDGLDYGPEGNYDSAPDWDHNKSEVKDMFKAYLKWIRNDVKIDGFRYDYCKGFHNGHINEYNRAAEAYFSVMEMWDGNVDVLKSHLNDAKWNTLTFDFATKYTAFNNGIASDNYCGLKGAGLPGSGDARYAVTFLDSHDSYQRDDNEFCGAGNSMTVCKDKIMQCYAYLLSMPGVPLVFFPHWVTFKDQIKPLINARYKTGVHSQSGVSDECGNGFYKATISGTNGEIRLLVGPNSGYNSTPDGFTLAGKGINYGVYYKTTSARGDKDKERQPIGEGIEEVTGDGLRVTGVKFMENGQLYIRCGEKVYDAMGRSVR